MLGSNGRKLTGFKLKIPKEGHFQSHNSRRTNTRISQVGSYEIALFIALDLLELSLWSAFPRLEHCFKGLVSHVKIDYLEH